MKIGRKLEALERFYGVLPFPPHDPFILFVWEVLSAQTTPQKAEAALNALRRLPALTPDAIWRVPRARLEAAVLLAGPYQEQRLRALRTGVDYFRRTPALPALIRGPLRAARRALDPLPHPGESGVRRMLLFAADQLLLPVDSRMTRLGARLGLSEAGVDDRKAARQIQRAVREALAPHPDAYRRAYLYLSHHGAATCTEGDPHCTVCPLLEDCPFGRVRAAEHAPRV